MRLFSTPKTSPELVRHAIVDDNIDSNSQCVILLIFLFLLFLKYEPKIGTTYVWSNSMKFYVTVFYHGNFSIYTEKLY